MREVWQFFWISEPSVIRFPSHGQLFEQLEYSEPQLAVIFTVESEGFDQGDAGVIQGMDFSIVGDFDAPAVSNLARVRCEVSGFGMVTGAASVNQIVVVQSALAVNRFGDEVVNLPVSSECCPGFSPETVNASETEFIPQPIQV